MLKKAKFGNKRVFQAKALYNRAAMRKQKLSQWLMVLVSLASVFRLHVATVIAQSVPSSSNYSTREYYFGTGGDNNLNSTSYSARATTGAVGVGNTSGTAYAADAGTITPQYEYIEFVVNSSTVNLGQQSTASTTYGTATFYVKAYVSSGYVVSNASSAPSIPSHTLASPSSEVASAAGTEQFGMNLVANSTGCPTPAPSNFGADPVQNPSGTYSFGAAATGYNTCGKFKYVNADVIARSTKSSGETDYTISYILNISSVTPAGTYVMNHVMVATGTY